MTAARQATPNRNKGGWLSEQQVDAGVSPPPLMRLTPQDKVLIVRLSAHGDCIQTWPLLGAIRAQYPDMPIGWLVESAGASLVEGLPGLTHVHVCPRQRWLKTLLQSSWQAGTVWAEMCAFRAELRDAGYTVAIDVQGLLKSALWPWLAGIPTRIGYAQSREWASTFYTHCMPKHDQERSDFNAVLAFLQGAQAVGAIPTKNVGDQLTPLAWPMPFIVPAFQKTERPRVTLALGTRWASKHWPEAHWHTLAEKLRHLPITLTLVGSLAEVPLADALTRDISENALAQWDNQVGKTSWAQLAEILAESTVVVGLDSAPLHLATAIAFNTGYPHVLGLFGATAPGRTGVLPLPQWPQNCSQNLRAPGDLACRPCFQTRCRYPGASNEHHACMRELTPALVHEAILAALPSESRLS